jgi:hypothetical protein
LLDDGQNGDYGIITFFAAGDAEASIRANRGAHRGGSRLVGGGASLRAP